MVDIASIIGIVTKGLSIAKTVWDNRDLALTAIDAVKDIVTSHNEGTLTQADIEATEADLDELLEEFNSPLPPD